METYIQNIELINQYLNNLLLGDTKTNFLNRLESDSEFNNLYQEHLIFIEGINRVALKQDIAKAHQSYKTSKWVKISGISIISIAALVLLYILVFNKSTSEEKQPSNSENSSFIQFETKTNTQEEPEILELDSINSETINIVNTKPDTLKTTILKTSTKSVSQSLKKKAQTLTFNANKDTTITCKEGTILKIKANSFVYLNSKTPVSGKVKIDITEYYKLSDMLMANLSTRSNNEQLETGGMLYIEAYKDDEFLKLNKNSAIDIYFPTQNKKENMQLFSGEKTEAGINWVLQKSTPKAVEITEEIVEEHIEVPFAVIEQAPMYPGCEDKTSEDLRRECFKFAINRHIQRNFNIGAVSGLGIKGSQRITSIFKINKFGVIESIQSNASHPKLIDEANRVIALLPRMIPGKQRGRAVTVPYSLPITFNINGEGQNITARFGSNQDTAIVDYDPILISSKTVRDTIYTNVRGITETIREIMHDKDFVVDSAFAKQWRTYEKQKLIRVFGLNSDRKVMLRKPLFEMENTRFKILETDSLTRGGHVIRIPLDESLVPSITRTMRIEVQQPVNIDSVVVSAREFENRLKNVDEPLITSKDVSYYALRSANLGWINCDRFVSSRSKVKYKLKIKNGDNAAVNMVFKSYNSILPGKNIKNEYDFGTVAKNEDILLVAIKKQDGKLYLDIIDTKTSETPSLDFNFKEVTIDELKAKLKALDKHF